MLARSENVSISASPICHSGAAHPSLQYKVATINCIVLYCIHTIQCQYVTIQGCNDANNTICGSLVQRHKLWCNVHSKYTLNTLHQTSHYLCIDKHIETQPTLRAHHAQNLLRASLMGLPSSDKNAVGGEIHEDTSREVSQCDLCGHLRNCQEYICTVDNASKAMN